MFVKHILARIFALWALLTFAATFIIIYIPAMMSWLLPDPGGQRYFIGVCRIWMTVWLPMTGCFFRIKGREHFKKRNNFIITCNHNSLMDVPLSSAFVPGANKTIAKSSFTKIPLFGFFYMKGSVIVDRRSETSRRKSFEKMKNVLSKGMHMIIYPEGTRNRTADPLKKFHDGAFRLAVDTNTPIVPTIILNTKKVLPLHRFFYFWPQRIEMHFLEPVVPDDMNTEQLKEKVFAIMTAYHVAHQK